MNYVLLTGASRQGGKQGGNHRPFGNLSEISHVFGISYRKAEISKELISIRRKILKFLKTEKVSQNGKSF